MNALKTLKKTRNKPMKEPDGKTLLETLINLYAEQEGVKITYEIEEGKKNV